MKKIVMASVLFTSLIGGALIPTGLQASAAAGTASEKTIQTNPVQTFFDNLLTNPKVAQKQFAKGIEGINFDVISYQKGLKEIKLLRLVETGNEKGKVEYSAAFTAKLDKGYNGKLTEGYNHLNFLVSKTPKGMLITSFGTDKQLASSVTDSYFAEKAVAEAKKNIGKPFLMGGNSPKGFDASGFVQYVYKQSASLNLPRTIAEQYKAGMNIKATEFQKGDLVFFDLVGKKTPTFVGIYVGNNQAIAATTSKGVKLININDAYWKPKIIGAKRVIN